MIPYIYLLLAIVGEIIGTTALKASYGMTKILPAIVVLLSYSICFWSLSITLKSLPVSIVYTMWSGLGIIAMILIGIYAYNETFTKLHFLGTMLILSGIILLMFLTDSPEANV